jgi:hypothetical protein
MCVLTENGADADTEALVEKAFSSVSHYLEHSKSTEVEACYD